MEFVGRTYDDFPLRPQPGAVPSRSEIGLACRRCRRLKLELPVVSANVDSVTGARMAETMGLKGASRSSTER